MIGRAISWVVDFEGSTRLVALIRIGLVLVSWSRFGYPLQLSRCADDPFRMLVWAVFWPASLLLLVGLLTPYAALSVAMCGFALYHGFGEDALESHHVLVQIIGLLLLSLTPCGRSLSIDRWLALRKAAREGQPPPSERGWLFGQRLLALHVAIVYLGTAYEKTYPGFLSGARLQQIYLSIYFGSDGPDASWFVPLTVLSAWLVTLAEWVLPFALFVPRLQPAAVPLGMLMHGIMYNQIPVATFSMTMWVLYLAFLDPERVHQATEDLA